MNEAMRRLFLILILLLSACTPTPERVSDSIVRGRLDEAVQRLAAMLNAKQDVSYHRVEQLLESIKASHHFNLDIADDLMDRLKPECRRAVFAWYMTTYLELVEKASELERFDTARQIWERNQSVRALLFPSYQEQTPVLGIIDLREAEFELGRHNTAKARKLLASARKQLTQRKPFDRIQSLNFKRAAEELTKKLK